MSFEAAQRIADAVLYEGYVLYPYRASSAKNQMRWQFGVVAPRAPREDAEPWFSHTECLIQPRRGADGPVRLSIRVRFLRPTPADGPPAAPAGWLEGVPHAIDLDPIPIGNEAVEQSHSLAGAGIDARVTVNAERTAPFIVVRARLENLEPWRAAYDDRDAMLRRSLVGAHLLCAVEGGAFVSLLEPPETAAALARACRNQHTWPVLVGDRSRCDLLLSSPIVLYDFPAIAKESPGDLYDATEIDEILSLRILTMTDAEKEEARATDPRARAIIDRVDAMTPGTLATLHGTMRSADFFNPPGTPAPDEATVIVNGVLVKKGSRVRLRPNRRADAMDMFLRDQAATVAGVYRDVDDRVFVAVTVDADPAASLHESFGRFFYFDPEEVEPASQQERV